MTKMVTIRLRRPMLTVVALAVAVLMTIVEPNHAEDKSFDDYDGLLKQVSSLEDEIATAQITYDLLQIAPQWIRPVSRDEVLQLLDRFANSVHFEVLQQLSQACSSVRRDATRMQMTLEGMRIRDTGPVFDRVVDEQYVGFLDKANKQLDIATRGNSYYVRSLGDLRTLVLRRFVESAKARGATNVFADDRTATLHVVTDLPVAHTKIEYVLDQSSGQVTEYRLYQKGRVCREIRQFAFADFPPGVSFPQVRVELAYNPSTGALQSLTATKLVNAVFNSTVDADAFDFHVGAGTTVVDKLAPEQGLVVSKTPRESRLDAVKRGLLEKKQPSVPGRSTLRPLIVAGSISIICILAGVCILTRRMRSARKP